MLVLFSLGKHSSIRIVHVVFVSALSDVVQHFLSPFGFRTTIVSAYHYVGSSTE